MTSIVDTHCHLDLSAFDEDRDAVIRNAIAVGVHSMVAIGFNPDRWHSTRRLCHAYPFMLRAVGVHPNDAGIWNDDVREALADECASGDPVAIGETGLDFFRDRADHEAQTLAFERQIELSRELSLPIIIHQRNAEAEVLEALAPYAPIRGVMHCFTGSASFASACMRLGLMLGIGGVATFPRSEELRSTIARLPLRSIIVETDAPYLAPQSQRGKRNSPALVTEVVEVIASSRRVLVESIADETTDNAIRLFGPRMSQALEQGHQAA
ncbi:MAG TPA: TatD family hydrolase [Thermomicrobiales bacterium]|nr:TatD family hydrolase [Thermomicrobiales bacterium]